MTSESYRTPWLSPSSTVATILWITQSITPMPPVQPKKSNSNSHIDYKKNTSYDGSFSPAGWTNTEVRQTSIDPEMVLFDFVTSLLRDSIDIPTDIAEALAEGMWELS